MQPVFRSPALKVVAQQQADTKLQLDTNLTCRLCRSAHHDVHAVQVDAISESLMPSGVRNVRRMFHATAVEVLLYLTPVHCQDMLDSLTTSLNATFTSFRKRNPTFKVWSLTRRFISQPLLCLCCLHDCIDICFAEFLQRCSCICEKLFNSA